MTDWPAKLDWDDWRLAVPVPVRELWDTFSPVQQIVLQRWAEAVVEEDHIVAQNAAEEAGTKR